MKENGIRIGRVSSVDYENGMIQVVYSDRDSSVTDQLPFLNFNGEYHMPDIDDMILVLHLSNGTAMGVVVGTFWSGYNQPRESGKGLYRKDFSKNGEAYFRYEETQKKLTIKAEQVVIETKKGTTTL